MGKALRDVRPLDVLTMIIILAILYGLVRPGSQAAAAVTEVSTALIALVGAATGYQTTSSTAAPSGGSNLTTV